MAHAIEFTNGARKSLADLDAAARASVEALLQKIAENPRHFGTLKLKGGENQHRARAGNYRVVYEINDAARTALILAIGDRKDIYRR